jgi:hypothetical protein
MPTTTDLKFNPEELERGDDLPIEAAVPPSEMEETER